MSEGSAKKGNIIFFWTVLRAAGIWNIRNERVGGFIM